MGMSHTKTEYSIIKVRVCTEPCLGTSCSPRTASKGKVVVWWRKARSVHWKGEGYVRPCLRVPGVWRVFLRTLERMLLES